MTRMSGIPPNGPESSLPKTSGSLPGGINKYETLYNIGNWQSSSQDHPQGHHPGTLPTLDMSNNGLLNAMMGLGSMMASILGSTLAPDPNASAPGQAPSEN